MSSLRSMWLAAVALALVIVPAGFGTVASQGATRALPPGCNLDIEQQSVSAIVNRAQPFGFHGYNAVPPGHAIKSVRFTWGDGTSSAGSAKASRTAPKKGCVDTVFTATHRYTRVQCQAGLCSASYPVTVAYTDARTNAKHTIRGLSVIVVKPKKSG